MNRDLFLRACRESGVPSEVTAHIRMHLTAIADRYDELETELLERQADEDAPEGGPQ